MNDPIDRAADMLRGAEAVLVTASNGLSITEGIDLFRQGDYFSGLFPDYAAAGVTSILHGMSARYPDEGMGWGFWSALVKRFGIGYRPTRAMEDLLRLTDGKPRFFLTSNGEGHFTSAGVPEDGVYEIEGNWRTMQCARGCHGGIYPSYGAVERMAATYSHLSVDPSAVPRCPVCGGPMRIRMAGDRFVKDTAAEARFLDFLSGWSGRRLVVLELGVGPRNTLIKAPMMGMVAREPEWRYITINKGELLIPRDIEGRSAGIDGPLEPVLAGLARRVSGNQT